MALLKKARMQTIGNTKPALIHKAQLNENVQTTFNHWHARLKQICSELQMRRRQQ
jgi:hypothetical protein